MPLFQAICPGCLWARDNRWLLSRVQRLAEPAGDPLLSRLVAPPGTKGPFCPGWCYQPGQKAPSRDNSKGSYSILSHVYYLGELVRKPYARQEVLGSNPVVCKIFLTSGTFCPGSAMAFVPEALSRFQNRDKRQFGTGTKGLFCSSCKDFFGISRKI